MDIRYIAGLFDGDGCIWYYRSPRVSITNLHRPTLVDISQYLGYGSLRLDQRSEAWTLEFSGANVEDFIDMVVDHVYIKKQQLVVMQLLLMCEDAEGKKLWDRELRRLKRLRYHEEKNTRSS